MARKIICFGIIAIYLGTALTAFFLKIDFLLFFLSIPWSMLITMFGFLIIHTSSDGIFIMNLGMLFGTIVNSILFLKICQPFKLPDA
jgi:hypothetical protein